MSETKRLLALESQLGTVDASKGVCKEPSSHPEILILSYMGVGTATGDCWASAAPPFLWGWSLATCMGHRLRSCGRGSQGLGPSVRGVERLSSGKEGIRLKEAKTCAAELLPVAAWTTQPAIRGSARMLTALSCDPPKSHPSKNDRFGTSGTPWQ